MVFLADQLFQKINVKQNGSKHKNDELLTKINFLIHILKGLFCENIAYKIKRITLMFLLDIRCLSLKNIIGKSKNHD